VAVKHPEYVLSGAAAVCLPMVPGLLDGEISAGTAGIRFLIALVVCWFLGSILSWVINTYSEQARRAQLRRLLEPQEQPSAGTGPSDSD